LLIIFSAAVLIDVDHWFIYVFKKKDFSIINSFKWFVSLEKSKKKPKFLFVFHTIESFLLLILLSTKYLLFQLILIGAIFHMFLDIADSIVNKGYRKDISITISIFKHARRK
jgi:hypothetical protein